MARITIIGGHGKVALRLTRLLAGRGHEVTSWIRSAGQAFDVKEHGGRAIMTNVEPLQAATMADLLRGEDALVWSAGAGGGNPSRTYGVDRDAAIRSIDAAELAGVPRYLMVSYFYDAAGHGVSPDVPFYHYAEAKAAADAHLRASSLDWTILGPSTLTDDPGTGLIEVAAPGVTGVSVTRDDVAAVASATLENPATYRRTINFNNGTTPIAEALTAEALG